MSFVHIAYPCLYSPTYTLDVVCAEFLKEVFHTVSLATAGNSSVYKHTQVQSVFHRHILG